MASKLEGNLRTIVGKGLMGVGAINRKLMKAPVGDHPYLTGINTPMTAEVTIETPRVTGTIPPSLRGRYLRNGPNPALPPDPASYHWFVGAGMVHGLSIADGEAKWYRNRWIKGEEACAKLGLPPTPGPRNGRSDAPNTNVIGLAGRTFAIVEAGGSPVELTRELETIAHTKFDDTLTNSYTAHPHECPETGERHAICYRGDVHDTVWHTVLDRDGHVIREEPIAVHHGPSIHDCQITAEHVLVFDLPVTFSMKRLIGGFPFPYEWNPEHRARVGVLARNAPGDSIIWCDVEPCYVFHTANAFIDADGRIIVDVCAHDRMFARSTQGPDSTATPFERWTIDTTTRKVARQVVDGRPQEFPRYDERLTGRAYRYAMTVALPEEDVGYLSNENTKLYRHDLIDGTTEDHDFGPHRHPGEFVFVPHEVTGGETDGWYVGLVIDMQDDTTDLVILDAANFVGDPVATIHLPHRIPPGFHGNWVSD